MKIVISLGGSVMVPDQIDAEYIGKFAKLAKELGKKHRLAIVCGGGRTARRYIDVARSFGAAEVFCDIVGVDSTRMNARLLCAALGESANREPARDRSEAARFFDEGKIVVMSGVHPGRSTDAVAALFSEYVGADLLVNASNVDGIYDKDPKKHKDAKRLSKISVEDLLELIKTKSAGAGKYELVDIMAVKMIQRSRIKAAFVDGHDLGNLKAAVAGKKFVGTTVTH